MKKTKLTVVESNNGYQPQKLIEEIVLLKSCNHDENTLGLRSCVCHLKSHWLKITAVVTSPHSLDFLLKPVDSKYVYAAKRSMFYTNSQVETMIRLHVVK